MHPLLHAFLAQTAEGQPNQNPIVAFLPFALIAVVFYCVFFRPQAKQAKQHQKFLSELKRGDEVVTQGGVIGTIVQVEDRSVTLDAGGGTKLRILKGQISGAWQERPPAPAAKPEKK